MSIDKQAIKDKIQLTWPNQEEKAYLVGLLEKDGIKGHCHGNTPKAASESKPAAPKKEEAKKEEPKKEEPKKEEKPEGSESSSQETAGSPGVITDEEAKKALEQ